jgi:hypothetical protein
VGAAFACIPTWRGQPRTDYNAATVIAAGSRSHILDLNFIYSSEKKYFHRKKRVDSLSQYHYIRIKIQVIHMKLRCKL